MSDPEKNELAPIEERRAAFLANYARTGRILASCKAAGLSKRQLEKARRDRVFLEAYEIAEEEYRESLREELYRRAVEGVEEPVYYKGMRIDNGENRRYSDRLFELELKRQCPEYREKVDVSHQVSGGVLVLGGTMGTIDEWTKKHGGTIDVDAE